MLQDFWIEFKLIDITSNSSGLRIGDLIFAILIILNNE